MHLCLCLVMADDLERARAGEGGSGFFQPKRGAHRVAHGRGARPMARAYHAAHPSQKELVADRFDHRFLCAIRQQVQTQRRATAIGQGKDRYP